MPQGDHTGPTGQGPGTGRKTGAGYGRNFHIQSEGFRKGRGRGYGRNRNSDPVSAHLHGDSYRINTPDKQDEITLLKSQASSLRHSLENIEKRITTLEREND